MSTPQFIRLNDGWNAEPNAPYASTECDGNDVLLRFLLNSRLYRAFEEDELGVLRFRNARKFRLGSTNDEGWHLGQCRYSKLAPAWGEFYELTGNDAYLDQVKDWQPLPGSGTRHFLFYLRDDTFEALAADWAFENTPENALRRLEK